MVFRQPSTGTERFQSSPRCPPLPRPPYSISLGQSRGESYSLMRPLEHRHLSSPNPAGSFGFEGLLACAASSRTNSPIRDAPIHSSLQETVRHGHLLSRGVAVSQTVPDSSVLSCDFVSGLFGKPEKENNPGRPSGASRETPCARLILPLSTFQPALDRNKRSNLQQHSIIG